MINLQFLICNTVFFLQLPQAKFYIKAFKETIKAELSVIPKQGLKKFNEINNKVKHAVEAATPALLEGLENARSSFTRESKIIDEVLDKTISAIHLKTKRMFKSFDDVYEKYGTEGETVHFFTFASIIIVSQQFAKSILKVFSFIHFISRF